MLRPEVMRICILGMGIVDVSGFSSLERGYKITRAALVADDSNYWWIVSCQSGLDVANSNLPEEVHPWVCPGWRERARRCKGRHVADRLPRSIV